MPGKRPAQRLTKASWKDVQSKIKMKQRTKLAIAVLALVIGLLILSSAIRFARSLFTPWKQPASFTRKYIWNKEFNINLLVRTDSISLLSYNPKEEKVIIVNIPDETFLEVPYGFGQWQLRAVYGLGGDQLLKDTLTQFLAVPVDGFLDLNGSESLKSTVQLVETLRKNPVSGFSLLSDLKTDLTVWELLQLKLSIMKVRFDKVKELDFNKLSLLNQENLPDGTPVLTADPVKLDSVLSVLADPAIAAEHKTIAVFNATERPQFANQWARLITNLGGNVIILANTPQTLKNTRVVGEKSLTLQRLRQVFGIDGKINPPDNDVSSRAQINVMLGEDYFSK